MDVKGSGNSECVGPCSSGSLSAVPAPIRKRRFSSAKIQPVSFFSFIFKILFILADHSVSVPSLPYHVIFTQINFAKDFQLWKLFS